MRLGADRVFHAAHKPDGICSITQPESAAHLNTKLYMAQQLRDHNTVFIKNDCSGYSRGKCSYQGSREEIYFKGWDKVEVEFYIDQYRPDIVLMKDGEAIGAIEVFVTHSLEPEKETHLQKLSIPWVEVKYTDIFPATNNGIVWTADQALNPHKLNRKLTGTWLCDKCEDSLNRLKIEQQRLALEKQYQIAAFRIIDYFYQNNRRRRSVYYAVKRTQNNKITEIFIKDSKEVICSIKDPDFKNGANIALRKKLDEHIESYAEKAGCRVDNHCKWHAGQEVPTSYGNNNLFPRRYIWSNTSHSWEPYPVYIDLDWNKYFSDPAQYISDLESRREAHNRYHAAKEKVRQQLIQKPEGLKKPEKFQAQVFFGTSERLEGAKDEFSTKTMECMFCHKMTDQYWASSNKTGLCRCRDCLAKGLANPKDINPPT
jgi:hypothetical protein